MVRPGIEPEPLAQQTGALPRKRLIKVNEKSSVRALLEKVSQTKVVRVDWLGNLANYKEDYNVSLFHVVFTVTVRIFCSSLLGVCSFTSQSLLFFVHGQRHISIGKRRIKTYNKESHRVRSIGKSGFRFSKSKS